MLNLFDKIKDFVVREYEDEDDYEDDYEYEYEPSQRVESRSPQPPIYGLREVPRQSSREIDYSPQPSRRSLPTPTQPRSAADLHGMARPQIKLVALDEFEDAIHVCDDLKNNRPVIVNIGSISDKEPKGRQTRQRIVDFLSGASYVLEVNFQKISPDIFIYAPKDFEISLDARKGIKQKNTTSPWANAGER